MFASKEKAIRSRLHRAVIGDRAHQWHSEYNALTNVSPLYRLRLLPSVECERRWTVNRELNWPQVCCLCGQEANREVDYYPTRVGRWLGYRSPVVRRVPHCEQHFSTARGNALFHIEVKKQATASCWMECVIYSASEVFLAKLLERIVYAPMLPPWIPFLWNHPWHARHNQGVQESYVIAWSRMFKHFNSAEQATYLDAVNAPALWRAWARGESIHEPPETTDQG